MKQSYWKFLVLALSFIYLEPVIAQTSKVTKAGNFPDTSNSFTVTLFSNGYAYPNSTDSTSNNISEAGLSNWKDPGVFTRIFFYPQQAGKIWVAVKLTSPENDSKIEVVSYDH